ncbi:hypothetical protein [Desulfocurvibacter africanus]|uniref:hypothetical protein n=1 Tax=Desulfocurvibacter africanus TaxID=873 RepID=UPI00042176C7|nr:hypothetical protein [Desulfocurvibacter africanus]
MIGNLKTAFSQGLREASKTARERVGAMRIDALGRTFRYARAGAALTAGYMAQAPLAVVDHLGRPVAATAVGDMHVNLTVGNTPVAENQYEGGLLMVSAGTGAGQAYVIAGNTACPASGTTMLTLEEPLTVALAAGGATKASLILSPWANVAASGVQENVPAGVPLVDVPANCYCWLQTAGVANCLTSGTPAVGTLLTFAAVPGALAALMINADAAADYAQAMPVVGKQYAAAGVDGECGAVYLMID